MAHQWILNGQKGFEDSLEYQENVPIPLQSQLNHHQVLVKLYAASLNYREIAIPSPQSYTGDMKTSVVPACDGAGIVLAVGSSVQEFQPGDRVVTYFAPKLVEITGDDEASCTLKDVSLMLGQGTDGTLRSHGVFSEAALVHAPVSLDWLAASTLTCTWATAWNALFGLKDFAVGPDAWILVQGSGGVSVAALQIAAAVGATVVATTSTEDKAARLRSLGAAYTVNYQSNSSDWGHKARQLTPDGKGYDIVLDMGGNASLPQSLAAVRTNGLVMVLGHLGGDAAEPVAIMSVLQHTCVVRGILGGSRAQLRELVRFVDKHNIKPALDDKVFELADARDAYRRLDAQKHFAKIAIRIRHSEVHSS
ncbi:putative alcohol dehydrogenase [Truncatella angustata]|uniref:Alcohol dehydrogenase n=1 Tax=Truncatella angustata TaxID=152316 RepID=A0A9P8RHU2_9PEZI|nr:putative alcohol dehydrogenase [Truncatella angustata]KAH6646094.1 putative alcohol dehydrogenase [Truncatella angustata]